MVYNWCINGLSFFRQLLFKKPNIYKLNMFIFKLMTELKHITVNPEVYKKLKNLGKAGDSFNDVLIKILSKQQEVYKIDGS